jgi:hypothetical protein
MGKGGVAFVGLIKKPTSKLCSSVGAFERNFFARTFTFVNNTTFTHNLRHYQISNMYLCILLRFKVIED